MYFSSTVALSFFHYVIESVGLSARGGGGGWLGVFRKNFGRGVPLEL